MNFCTRVLAQSTFFLMVATAAHGMQPADFIRQHLTKFDRDFETHLGGIASSGVTTGDPIDQVTQLIKVVGDLEEAKNRISILNYQHKLLLQALENIKPLFERLTQTQQEAIRELLVKPPYKTTFEQWIAKRREILEDKLKQIQGLQVQLQQQEVGGGVTVSPEYKERRAAIEAAMGKQAITRRTNVAEIPRTKIPKLSEISPKLFHTRRAPSVSAMPTAPAFLTEVQAVQEMPQAPAFVQEAFNLAQKVKDASEDTLTLGIQDQINLIEALLKTNPDDKKARERLEILKAHLVVEK